MNFCGWRVSLNTFARVGCGWVVRPSRYVSAVPRIAIGSTLSTCIAGGFTSALTTRVSVAVGPTLTIRLAFTITLLSAAASLISILRPCRLGTQMEYLIIEGNFIRQQERRNCQKDRANNGNHLGRTRLGRVAVRFCRDVGY